MTDTKRQQRRARQHAAIREEIKAMARSHMARDGAAALSLRAVASDLGLSSAAIYYYFPNRDDLITALIVDAFRALGQALRAADDPAADIAARLERVMLAYRAWAVANPSEYALLFGTPIPGYVAPEPITTPEARAAFAPLVELFAVAFAQGRLQASPVSPPPRLVAHAEAWIAATGNLIPLPALLAAVRAWALGHGLIGLELDHQTQSLIGDPADHFHYEIHILLHQFGVTPDPAS
jgi:AcrR family transcriptional regulator